MSTASATTMGVQEAYDALDHYGRTYGRLPLLLLLHAAVPQSFRADLLNLLKLNFLPEAGQDLTVDADVLFSPLTEATGGGYYRLDVEVRRHCLALLNATYRHEPEARTRRVGRFLMAYAEHFEKRSTTALDPLLSEFVEIQRWVALAFIDAEVAATRFAEALETLASREAVTHLRLGSITAAMSVPLTGHQEIISYARGLDALVAGDIDRGRQIMERLGDRSLEIGGVSLDPAAQVLDRFLEPEERIRRGPLSREAPESPAGPRSFRDAFVDGSGQGPDMVWISGGTFRMGSPQGVGQDDERPAHEVTLSHFAVGKYPVTLGEFRRFVEATGYRTEAETGDGAYVWSHGNEKVKDASWRKPYFEQSDQHPVVCISWNDAQAYCQWLSGQTDQTYALLTEAQWEYACRAARATAFSFGDNERGLEQYAWYGEGFRDGSTHPVGEKRPNAWGLHDIHGNVWEWVQDRYGPYSDAPQRDPSGPESSSSRVIRGGSWFDVAGGCRSAFRGRSVPGNRSDDLGFRLARTGPLSSYPFTFGPEEPEQRLCDLLSDDTPSPAMAYLPGGRFRMGSPESEAGRREYEGPVHEVTLSGFSVGHYPVTFEDYERFCRATERKVPNDRGWGRGGRPVINVAWGDSVAYCDWLSQETGATYRLLTEAEWEYACRAGSETAYCFGSDAKQLGDYAWFAENEEHKTHPVYQKRPNAWGLYDTHGNVWEWVQDWYGPYSDAPQRDPSGPESGSNRVIRGGSWDVDAENCRSASRRGSDPGNRIYGLGFRLARTGKPAHAYPFPLGAPELEKPKVQEPETPIPQLRDTLKVGGEGPDMVWLPGGTFRMGQDDSQYDDEKPAHEVSVGTFSVGQYPVTFEEYDRFCEATGRERPNDRRWGRATRPVINVSWDDAASYCEWLSRQTGARYRLLTEAEWEYACRAGHATRYSFGDDERLLSDHAWFSSNSGRKTHPVGRKRSNPWHLRDMHGNVDEWVQDWYSASYYKESQSENPNGPETGSYRVIRGGSWRSGAGYCRSACRGRSGPLDRYDDYLGFRLARTGPWHLDALTLARRRAAEDRASPEPEQTRKPKYEPYQAFRDRFEDESEAPEVVYLPGGTFKMGDGQGKGLEWERPVHAVTLDAFAIGRTPVTVGEYLRFVKDTGKHHPVWLEEGSQYHIETGSKDYYRKRGMRREALDLPIVGISWEDAKSYCAWLSKQTSERYELPTEAEWEYACRGGSEDAYCFGNDPNQLGDYAWCSDNAGGKVHPVRQKQPNRFGLHDLHGNVWEWVHDWFLEDYYEQLSSATDSGARSAPGSSEQSPSGTSSSPEQNPSANPRGPESGSSRVIRGGSWDFVADYCRSAYRYGYDPGDRGHLLGFRLARRV